MNALRCLVAALLVVGCDSQPAGSAKPAAAPAGATPPASPEPTAPVVDPEPGVAAPVVAAPSLPVAEVSPAALAPRVFIFSREVPKLYKGELFLPVAGGEPRELGLRVEYGSGHSGVGDSDPMLSADGQWLAYLQGGKLSVRRLAGGAPQVLSKTPERSVATMISGWSPDSQSLLFHLGQVDDMDGTPMPKSVKEGFYVARAPDWKVEPVADLPAFEVWLADSEHVLYQSEMRPYRLMRAAIDGPKAELLLEDPELTFGFSQLTSFGDEIAYNGERKLVRSKLDGSGLTDVSPEGPFAYYQSPRFSPAGQHVAYNAGEDVEVIELATGTRSKLTSCANKGCRFRWDSPTSVLVLGGGKLSRVQLGGASEVIADGVAGFYVAGG